MIDQKDKEILRELANKQLDYANCQQNDTILNKWNALAEGRRETPTVRLLFSNFPDEVICPRIRCKDATARRIESELLHTLVGRELFNDDTPISPTFDVKWDAGVSVFGTEPVKVFSDNSKGHHIEPLIYDLEEDFHKLLGGKININRDATKEYIEVVNSVIGDILPVRMVMSSLRGTMTSPMVNLMGMENFYVAMYDSPEKVHDAMELACSIYERYYDLLADEKMLLPTNGISPIDQESFAFNSHLPYENVTDTTQCWGFLESQESTAMSPQFYAEFVYPYQDRLAKRFGLLSYGCCERVDNIWEDYLSKWKHLKKLSVSPFNNEPQIGEYLRGTDVVYYSKPRAEFVTNRGPLDEEATIEYFKGVCEAASGCLFEIAQREVGTIYGDFNRGKKYVELAKYAIDKYWKP